jgi:hypothetical protein
MYFFSCKWGDFLKNKKTSKTGKPGSQNCSLKVSIIDRARKDHPNMSLSSILELLLNKEKRNDPKWETQKKLTEFMNYMKLNFHPELVDLFNSIYGVVLTCEDLQKNERIYYEKYIRSVIDAIFLEINNKLGKTKIQPKKVLLVDFEEGKI